MLATRFTFNKSASSSQATIPDPISSRRAQARSFAAGPCHIHGIRDFVGAIPTFGLGHAAIFPIRAQPIPIPRSRPAGALTRVLVASSQNVPSGAGPHRRQGTTWGPSPSGEGPNGSTCRKSCSLAGKTSLLCWAAPKGTKSWCCRRSSRSAGLTGEIEILGPGDRLCV